MLDLILRPMAPTDEHYVLSSWILSYAKSPERYDAYGERRAEFIEDYKPLVVGMMTRGQVVIACLPENQDVVVGWFCFEGDTLHYVLVKPRFRECGVAGKMLAGLESVPLAYSHITPPAKRRLRFPDAWKYRPYRRFGT